MTDHDSPRRRFLPRRPASLALIGAGLLAIGGVAGAVATAETRPSVTMAPATPTPIRSLAPADIVTIRGRVAEVFGNKFVLADGTGRALVDTGPEGDERAPVAIGAPVTVQGRFEDGFMRAAFLVGPDMKVLALGLTGRPPHGPHDGPGRGRGAPPPPPAAAAGEAAQVPPPVTNDGTVVPVPIAAAPAE